MEEADRDFLANEKIKEGNRLYYAKDYESAIKAYLKPISQKLKSSATKADIIATN